jgi:hypothetical protein
LLPKVSSKWLSSNRISSSSPPLTPTIRWMLINRRKLFHLIRLPDEQQIYVIVMFYWIICFWFFLQMLTRQKIFFVIIYLTIIYEFSIGCALKNTIFPTTIIWTYFRFKGKTAFSKSKWFELSPKRLWNESLFFV